jgi:hypothetical protein
MDSSVAGHRSQLLAKGAVTAFLALNTPFYFVAAHVPLVGQRLFGLALVATAAVAARRLALHGTLLLLAAFFVFLNVAKMNLGALSLQNAMWFTGLPVVVNAAVMFAMSSEDLADIFDWLVKLILASTVPGLIVWLALLVGIELPYSLISLSGRGDLYRSYSGVAIFTDYTIYRVAGVEVARLCGMFEEPGMLGTIAGVLLATDVLVFDKRHPRRKGALAVVGTLTFSLAFFAMAGLVAVYYAFSSRTRFVKAAFIGGLAALLFARIPAFFDAAELFYLSRLRLGSGGTVSGDTRSQYVDVFDRYLASASPGQLLFGNGPGSNSLEADAGFSSYHLLVYEYGLFACGVLLIFLAYFLLVPLARWRRPLATIVMLGPLLSIYQRPDVTAPHYILLFALLFVCRDVRRESRASRDDGFAASPLVPQS